VIGDLIGSGEAQERGIVGETPNLAARLQGVAEPNMVVIAEGTRKLLGNLFELVDLGARDLKGISGSVRAWAALRQASVESRFEAFHASGLTDLVGREEELELLLRRWARAKTGEGQMVLLSGEAGIGKSRLTAALLERLTGEPHTRLRYFCSPQHTDSAFYPSINQMERAAGLAHNDTLQEKLDKLDTLLAQTATAIQDAPLFADMLSLPNDGRYPALQLEPQQRRQRTLEALLSQVQVLTRQAPVLMIFEDAHWADPTSLEAFGRTVDRIARLPVLMVVTFRPEFDPPWIGRPYLTAVTLNRLGERDIGAIIDGIIGNKLIAVNVRQDIIERTDGIPLFVEEMTKAVLEAESEGDAQKTTAAVPSPALSVPASLHASLMARLDRLGPAKEVAQIGAAIGREFSHPLLAAVVRKPEAELVSTLDRLITAGLLFRQGVPPHATYLFKHALVQDAAYGTLLREPRRALHDRIAETLERQFAEIAENQPELLARHWSEAGLIEKAANLWGKAGQRSLRRSALMEAVEQLTRALSEIGRLPGTATLRRNQINFQLALANALMLAKGYAAPEAKAAFQQANLFVEQAEAYGEHLEDPLSLFSVLYGLWAANLVAFNRDAVLELARQFLALAEKQAATVPRMIGHRIMGSSLLNTGDVVEARLHLDRALSLYEPAEHSLLATRFGQDIAVPPLSWRSFALWLLGYPDAALADADNCLKHARAAHHAPSLMYALANIQYATISSGQYAVANEQLDELISLAEEKGALFWKAVGSGIRGSLLALTGRATEAVHVLTIANSAYRSTGAKTVLSWHLSNLAIAYGDLGQFADAERWIIEALALIGTTKENDVRARGQSHCGRNRTQIARARRRESGSLFRACARGCTPTASKVLGTSRRNEPRAALA